MENDPTYSDEKRQLYQDSLDDLNTEKQERLEILSKIEKIFKHKSQGSNKLLERYLIKINLCQKEFVPYFVNRVEWFFQYWLPFWWLFPQLYFLLQESLGEVEGQEVLHQKIKGFEKIVRQVSRCTQNTCRQGHGIRFWIYMDFNCFCCRSYWCMVDAESIEEASRKEVIVLFCGPQYPSQI